MVTLPISAEVILWASSSCGPLHLRWSQDTGRLVLGSADHRVGLGKGTGGHTQRLGTKVQVDDTLAKGSRGQRQLHRPQDVLASFSSAQRVPGLDRRNSGGPSEVEVTSRACKQKLRVPNKWNLKR